MIKPAFLERNERAKIIGHAFGTPVVVKGITWLPMIELAAWGMLYGVAGKKHPEWPRSKRVCAGILNGSIMLACEWCHNLSHIAFASRIGKPADGMRIVWGTPILIYYDINDKEVTPRQHILRSIGGPAFNATMVPLLWCVRQLARRNTLSRYVMDWGYGTNLFIMCLSLLPIPGIDGGPILKWTLVQRGDTVEKADEKVKGVNRALGVGLGLASGVAGIKGHKWWAAALAVFAATALGVGFGQLKEQKQGNQERKNG